MTTDDLRDELAREMGWKMHYDKDGDYWTDYANRTYTRHPIPATRDGAAAAMPEGVSWCKYKAMGKTPCPTYRAYDNKNRMVAIVEDTGDEIHDRLALALAARRAMKGQR